MTNPIKICTLMGLVVGVIIGAYRLGQINEATGFPVLLDFVSVSVMVLSIVFIGAIAGFVISFIMLITKEKDKDSRL